MKKKQFWQAGRAPEGLPIVRLQPSRLHIAQSCPRRLMLLSTERIVDESRKGVLPVGMLYGTAAHLMVGKILEALDGNLLAGLQPIIDTDPTLPQRLAKESLDQALGSAPQISWDKKTPNSTIAALQLEELAGSVGNVLQQFHENIMDGSERLATEQKLQAHREVGAGRHKCLLEISGRADILSCDPRGEPKHIIEIKTGDPSAGAISAQVGAYELALRAQDMQRELGAWVLLCERNAYTAKQRSSLVAVMNGFEYAFFCTEQVAEVVASDLLDNLSEAGARPSALNCAACSAAGELCSPGGSIRILDERLAAAHAYNPNIAALGNLSTALH